MVDSPRQPIVQTKPHITTDLMIGTGILQLGIRHGGGLISEFRISNGIELSLLNARGCAVQFRLELKKTKNTHIT